MTNNSTLYSNSKHYTIYVSWYSENVTADREIDGEIGFITLN